MRVESAGFREPPRLGAIECVGDGWTATFTLVRDAPGGHGCVNVPERPPKRAPVPAIDHIRLFIPANAG